MNCPNCGRELAEGEVCTCTQNEVFPNAQPIEPPVSEVPAEEPVPNPYQAQPNYYQSPQNDYYNPQQPPYVQPQGAYYAPPVVPVQARTDYPEGYKIKRKYVAVILAATLGCFGIHNFYLGNSGRATAQVLLATVGSLFFGLGLIAAEIWAIVEAVQLLTEKINMDANGFKIQTFEEALVAERMKAEAKENER